jgi:hypothetical protein
MSKKRSHFKEKLHWFFGHIMAIIAVALVVTAFGGAYFLVVAPNLVSKPLIEKPSLSNNTISKIQAKQPVINSSHINYLINEVGAYKLHKQFGTENYPIIEFVITDVNQIYYAYVKDNKPVTKKGNAKNEDIIIRGNQEIIFEILSSDNLPKAVKQANNNNEIEVELISDMKTLAAKGYLSLYNSLR